MTAGPPTYLIEHCERLLVAAEPLSGLDEDLGTLRGRLERGDLSALRIGMRRITEGILRHLARAFDVIDDGKRPHVELDTLRTEVVRALGPRVTPDFKLQLENLQRLGNVSAHYRGDDVYQTPGLRGPNPWNAIQTCFSALEHVLDEFFRLCPPPAPEVPEPVEELEPEPLEELQPEPLEELEPEPHAAADPPEGEVGGALSDAELARLPASRAVGNLVIRARLAELTGMAPRAVTRRLNAARGNTHLRRLFPNAFGAPGAAHEAEPSHEEPARVPTYEALGECRLSLVREVGLEKNIAKLACLPLQTVRRRVAENRGNSLVRRVFPEWYDGSVIGQLTVRTAIDFEMETLLARAVGVAVTRMRSTLRQTPGQTKIASVVDLTRGG